VEHLETMYFLEWLAQESGFTENQILENMRPGNHHKEIIRYNSIEEFLEKTSSAYWIADIFQWSESFLKPDANFWRKMYPKWQNLVDSERYNIEFSRYPIENWRIVKPQKKIKIKSKLKI